MKFILDLILTLASLVGTVLVTLFIILVLVLIGTTITYLKTKTNLLKRQIKEYDFSENFLKKFTKR